MPPLNPHRPFGLQTPGSTTMLSTSAKTPIFFHLPKPLKPLSSLAHSHTPNPSNPPKTPNPPKPLFLRPLHHPTTLPSLLAFRRWAAALVPASSPHLHRELQWLLAEASHHTPHSDAVLLRAALDDLRSLWQQRVLDRRPFQYILGNEHWRDLVLVVREGVLIPRPETEMVVDLAAAVEGFEGGWWADLGTGSGAIAVALGRMVGEKGRVFATDVSAVAVEVSMVNVERYGLQDKVEIRQGSWFEPLEDVKGKLTGVISNPPYIPTDDLPGLQPEVGWHEPKLALDGGKEGLDHLVHLCEGLASALKPGGFFAFETNGDKQSEFLIDFMSTKWGDSFRDVKVVLDFAGIKRFVTGFRR